MDSNQNTYYERKEELWNIWTHAFGTLLALAGTALLVTFSSLWGNAWHIVGASIFGGSMIILYLASTLYHASQTSELRRKLNIFDHAAIYILIAGSYTPFTLIAIRGALGWSLFGIAWGLAITGVILKLFFTGKYEKLSTISYVLLGWIAVIGGKSLWINLPTSSLVFLLIGGGCYTIGAVFYAFRKLPYNHAIFHIWVLAGTICHFFSVLYLI